MCHSIESRYRRQFEFLRRQFLQDGERVFSSVFSEELVSQALELIDGWRDRIYSPLVTLWVFVGQVISADHSCRAAVSRLLSHRISNGQSPCSSETGAYCRARKRLPEEFFAHMARGTGTALAKAADSKWLWKGRKVYMFDGTTISMPDTQSNQAAYPQPTSQTPGVGFPLARVAAIFSLSCGAILDLGIAAYSGKGQGEVTIFRRLWDLFRPGDVVLTDALMGNFRSLCALQQRGVDVVTRLNKAKRTADFRRGKRLAKNDHLVTWPKPFMRDMSVRNFRSS